jgi:DNA-binding CsgD family transcriptional regulator
MTNPRQELLSPRELEVMSELARGNKRKQIALKLGISYWTVAKYMHRVRVKLGANTTEQAISMCQRNNLFR